MLPTKKTSKPKYAFVSYSENVEKMNKALCFENGERRACFPFAWMIATHSTSIPLVE